MNLTLFLVFSWIPIIIFITSTINYWTDYVSTYFDNFDDEVYDFIIVGAGSSGAVIANRLSKNHNVLLIEAGGYPLSLMKIPGFAWDLIHYEQHDWNYKTVPQKHACLSANGSMCSIPRGKVLGGSSNLNLMQYVRGHPLDYDEWAKTTNDESWSYENLLPYFKKSINYYGEFKSNEAHYGNSSSSPYAYLHVEPRSWTPMKNSFFEAGQELGYDVIDLNGPQRSGFGVAEFNTKWGRRQDTFTTFLEPFLTERRNNLKIVVYAHATKIHFDKHKRATAVSYTKYGKHYKVSARKEIIISAGAIDTPKLLMLSGIGPKKHLENIGVKPVSDLPVGENLQDHVAVPIGPFLINETSSYLADRNLTLRSVLDYIFYGDGPLSSSAVTSGQAFIHSSDIHNINTNTNKVVKKSDWVDLQLYMLSVGTSDALAKSIASSYGIQYETLKEFYSPYYGQDSFLILIGLVRPKSIGSLTLASKNVFDAPNINPNYLQHPDDRKALLNGIQFVLKLVESTKSFQKLNSTLSSNPFPPCSQHKFKSLEYWSCYISRFSTAFFHVAGTCKMGSTNDETAVVDSKLRVIGTSGLRVADASIMPNLVNGNTNAPCIMIGEKVSDIIREYWTKQVEVCSLSEYYLTSYIYYNWKKLDYCFYLKIV